MENMPTCRNCGEVVSGKFCGACGQKLDIQPITVKNVSVELRQHVVQFDHGFLYTIKMLLLRPGHTIREYFDGKRVKIVKPIKFLFWMTAASFFVSHYFRLEKTMLDQMEASKGANDFGRKASEWAFENPMLMQLLYMPVIAWFAWLLFRKQGRNFAEHFVTFCYSSGMLALISVLFIPIIFITGKFSWFNAYSLLTFVVWILYTTWIYRQMFRLKSVGGALMKSTIAIVVGFVVFIVVATLAVIALLALSPSFRESMLPSGG